MPRAADTAGRRDQPEFPPATDRLKHDQPAGGSSAHLQRRLEVLPDGHPSSPYLQDGSRRAPAVSLRDLELPADDGDDQPESVLDASGRTKGGDAPGADAPDLAKNIASDTWRDAMPGLEAAWRNHLERWPEAKRTSIDRSTDEPGSWRGDGGHYLTTREAAEADRCLDRASAAEPELTRFMKSIEVSVPGTLLVGLQHCLKGIERLKEKIASEVSEKSDRSVDEIVGSISDKIRYTCQFRVDEYTDGYWKVRAELEGQGNQLILSRNSWGELEYKGINTRWMTGAGQRFEVQFHTSDSFEAKQLTHGAYERLRSGESLGTERAELEEFQRLVTSEVDIPDKAVAIPDYRREGY